MSARRILALLAALTAIFGLNALPSAFAAHPRTVAAGAPDDSTSADDTSADDLGDDTIFDDSTAEDDGSLDDTSCDDTGAGDDSSAGDDFGDDTASDDDADFRQAGADDTGDDAIDDVSADDDPFADDPIDDDPGDISDDCAGTFDDSTGDGGATGGSDEMPARGTYTDTVDMPGPGSIDEELDAPGGASVAAVHVSRSKSRVVGRGHKAVKKAGRVSVRVKLNGKGKKLARTTRRAVKLTLHTKVRLKSGKTLQSTKTLTLEPKPKTKKPHKKRH